LNEKSIKKRLNQMEQKSLERILKLYDELGLSPEEPLRAYLQQYIKKKIHRYESEIKFYERKYRAKLEDIKKCSGDDFDFEDELMDWEFAFENLKFWKNKLKQIGI